MRSVTWDQGTEMARHLATTDKLGAPVYFCDLPINLAKRHQRKHQRTTARLLPQRREARLSPTDSPACVDHGSTTGPARSSKTGAPPTYSPHC